MKLAEGGGYMNIGYARVSTDGQDHELQRTELLKHCEERYIFTDTISGAKAERPALDDMLSKLRPGDIVHVWKLDRLGRSLKHLVELVEYFNDNDIGFVSLTEGFDTTTNGGKLIFHIFGALAEFERGLIEERTRAGLAAARARGRHGGRKHALTDKQVKVLRAMYDSREHSVSEIASTFKISRATVYRYLAREGK
jgi:DNA invertase Pin-like site-specific DNA recombinase